MSGRRPRRRRGSPAATRHPRPSSRLAVWLRTWAFRHAQAALGALGRFLRAPLAALMSVAVIGIAAALPALLYVLVDNAGRLLTSWEGTGSLSLFLRPEIEDAAARKLAERIRARPGVADVQLIGREQGLAEFRRLSGFGAALDALGANPFPAVLVVHAGPTVTSAEQTMALARDLQQMPEAEAAQADLDWVRRFQGFAAVAERVTLVLAAFLAAGVLFVVGNILRLEIRSRQAEIEITALVGGTAGFIRRPFLYLGMWLGLLGGSLGWLLVLIGIVAVDAPIARLADLYQSRFILEGGGFALFVTMAGGGAMLGLAGAWLAVARQLDAALPR
jgi:cell division transport system permease protein